MDMHPYVINIGDLLQATNNYKLRRGFLIWTTKKKSIKIRYLLTEKSFYLTKISVRKRQKYYNLQKFRKPSVIKLSNNATKEVQTDPVKLDGKNTADEIFSLREELQKQNSILFEILGKKKRIKKTSGWRRLCWCL